jgi:hypothetical protein|tara:strand:+ start:1104 stop:1373 length:270 start_codon:yes stop_codon:yes gene_type:complete
MGKNDRFLVNGDHPCLLDRMNPSHRQGISFEGDTPSIGRFDSTDDFDQSGFAGSILTAKGVPFSWLNLQRDIAERLCSSVGVMDLLSDQ